MNPNTPSLSRTLAILNLLELELAYLRAVIEAGRVIWDECAPPRVNTEEFDTESEHREPAQALTIVLSTVAVAVTLADVLGVSLTAAPRGGESQQRGEQDPDDEDKGNDWDDEDNKEQHDVEDAGYDDQENDADDDEGGKESQVPQEDESYADLENREDDAVALIPPAHFLINIPSTSMTTSDHSSPFDEEALNEYLRGEEMNENDYYYEYDDEYCEYEEHSQWQQYSSDEYEEQEDGTVRENPWSRRAQRNILGGQTYAEWAG